MSTVNVRSSYSAEGSVDYALYGGAGRSKAAHLEAGTDRAAAVSCSVASIQEFVALAQAHGRDVQVYSYTQNFPPAEFDVNNPAHVKRVNELGVKLVQDMHSAEYLVVTHGDAKGGHAHNHVYAINNDTITGKSLQRNVSWTHGLHQLNDRLMVREGCQVLASPMRAKPEWSLRREEFAVGGFEQTLGDSIAAALRDPRSADFDGFAGVLREHTVTVSYAKSGELRYKSRHPASNKIMSKSGARLTPEFTAAGTAEVFKFHAAQALEREQEERESEKARHGHLGRSETAGGRAEVEHATPAFDFTELDAEAAARAVEPDAVEHTGPERDTESATSGGRAEERGHAGDSAGAAATAQPRDGRDDGPAREHATGARHDGDRASDSGPATRVVEVQQPRLDRDSMNHFVLEELEALRVRHRDGSVVSGIDQYEKTRSPELLASAERRAVDGYLRTYGAGADPKAFHVTRGAARERKAVADAKVRTALTPLADAAAARYRQRQERGQDRGYGRSL